MDPSVSGEGWRVLERFQHQHRTGLLALLFTDLVDSVALKRRVGDRAAVALVQEHHERLRAWLREFPDAAEVETAGDSFLLVFARPSDAVRFALGWLERLRQLARERAVPLQDRVGIHAGEVFVAGEPGGAKLFGSQVDVCARVMGLAQGDQILMSRFVFDNARQVLRGAPTELAAVAGEGPALPPLCWLNHGPFLFKGIEEPVEVGEVGRVGLAPLRPPPTGEKASRVATADVEPVLGWRPALGQPVPQTKWVLEDKLGEGGFGEVWRARHEVLREERVFKFCFRADRIRSLRREVALFRLLKERVGEHPNIVRLHDVYFDQPPYYLEEEYVSGRDLRTWSEAQGGLERVPLELRLEMVAQAAEALQAAHDAGIVHRDIKPGNILVESPRAGLPIGAPGPAAGGHARRVTVKLTDFGIGQVVSEEYLAGITRSGFGHTILGSTSSAAGTQLYMAPELLAGKPASVSSDIYSLGVVLYQLIVADFNRPLTTDWTADVTDPLLRDDLRRCFAGNPKERFGSALELARSLRLLNDRRLAWETEQSALAAAARAAYRRGVFRAASVASVIVLGIGLLASYALRQKKVAEDRAGEASAAHEAVRRGNLQLTRAVRELEWQQAEALFDAGKLSHGLAYLARFLRQDVTNAAVATRALSALDARHVSLPVLEPLPHDGQVLSAKFGRDGRWIVTGSTDGKVRLWDAASGRLLFDPMVHEKSVVDVSVSPDSRMLASASVDGCVNIWDTATGQRLVAPLRHNARVVSLEFSPDGRRFSTAGVDGKANVWDTANGQRMVGPLEHREAVFSARFNPRGDRLVTCSKDGTARIWDGLTGVALTPPLQHADLVSSAQFSVDGAQVITTSWDMTAAVWDARTGERIGEPLRHEDVVWTGELSPDGRLLLTSVGHSAVVWDLATRQPVGRPVEHDDYSTAVRFSPDGARFISGSVDGAAYIWETRTGLPVTEPLRHGGPVRCVAFGPVGNCVLTGAEDQTARVWELRAAGRLPRVLAHQAEVWSAEFSPDGHRVVSASSDKTAQLWEVTSPGKPPLVLSHPHIVEHAVFSPDGKLIVTGSIDGAARVWRAATGELVSGPLAHPAGVWYAQFSGDGRTLVTACLGGAAAVWDVASGTARTPLLRHEHRVLHVDLRPDGREVVTASQDGTARLWDTQSGAAHPQPLRHLGLVWCARFSPDGLLVATASSDKTARLWDARTDRELGPAMQHGGQVKWVQFSGDGKRLVTASTDRFVRVWEVPTGRLLVTTLSHRGPVETARFSPDSRRIVSASADMTARVWDAATGKLLAENLPHDGKVTGASFSPDGQWIVTSSTDGNARLWPILNLTEPPPDWLPDFVEAIAGQRIKAGGLEPVPPSQVVAFIRRFQSDPGTDSYSRWTHRFVANPPVAVGAATDPLSQSPDPGSAGGHR